jgi:hypothetical protein
MLLHMFQPPILPLTLLTLQVSAEEREGIPDVCFSITVQRCCCTPVNPIINHQPCLLFCCLLVTPQVSAEEWDGIPDVG